MNNIIIREASINDAKIIFDLSNDDSVRKNSINKDKIKWEDHIVWFKAKLGDDNYKLLLFFFENKLIGQVKFEIKSAEAIISISLHQSYRGRGLAQTLLVKATDYLFEKINNITKIIALIEPENKASIKAFSKVKFSLNGNFMIGDNMFLRYILERSVYDN